MDIAQLERPTDEGIYARELAHRTANILQHAIAALHLASRGDTRHTWQAIERISGAADLQRILAGEDGDGTEIGEHIADVCRAVRRMNATDAPIDVVVRSERMLLDGRSARRMGMIVAELVGNAIRHGVRDRGGTVTVTLRRTRFGGRLAVEDDGAGGGWVRNGGQGHGIVNALAGSLGGHVRRSRTRSGLSRVEVTTPPLLRAAPSVGPEA
ncbi:ATP-binding protein [Sphingomonas sp. 2SG]|uniref:ATP-binding protein n=1 Tax=Sphingomonas sp. 2SG TaxID=2502201 RepID=UPI001485657F|nr:ATP-binding protein [Sphingomonas sp. 2SG]